MSLSDWDKAIIDSLARSYRVRGKEPARKAYHKMALANGWHGTDSWIEGRTIFKKSWSAYRKAYNDSLGSKSEV